MRKFMYLVIVFSFLLTFVPGPSYCSAAASQLELDLDYLTPYNGNRDLDTVSLHILKKISDERPWSFYRGVTITRPHGDVTISNQSRSSSAVGVGPVYLFRNEKKQSDKFSIALDVSGGLILYDKVFPAGGRHYNFMWRIGPQFIYKTGENSSLSLGYMVVHVSNGFKTHNPGYDGHGLTLGFVNKF